MKKENKVQAEKWISKILMLADRNFKIIMIDIFKNKRKRQTK